MSLLVEERLPESPYIESIMYGQTLAVDSVIRPAENHWHLVLIKDRGQVRSIVVGPWTQAGTAYWEADAEIVWIRFRAGTFMPHLPVKMLVNQETTLPEASSRAFWLQGSAWQVPDYAYADIFVEKLVRTELLVRDPLVEAALRGEAQDVAPRTLRHRVKQATGLNLSFVRQLERAKRAEALLKAGTPIADTVFETGYFDQPHLTRSLKALIGHTPAQLVSQRTLAVSYKTPR